MKFNALPLPGAFLVEPEPHGDNRGIFSRLFCAEEFSDHGLATSWTQCNMSSSFRAGTIRGLHFQRPPSAETKLVRCTRGAIFDVIVDLRLDSPSFGKWHAERLDNLTNAMMYVPEGFAHGFQTLTENVEMFYWHSASFSSDYECGLRWDDPLLAIPWPRTVTDLSRRDMAFSNLKELEPIRL